MKREWWHDKVAYQIYPKSFFDSNGDGIGDVRGIISRLDYLKDLGVDILWLSPIYKSPLADEGYDISDYYALDPRFGTMKDMEDLVAEARSRDMYIVMDLVANHCSDEHEWFRKACEDPDGKYGRFFYLREKNSDGSLPTNWRSYFGGPCWDELPGTDKYYLHVFHKKQPDLNWENPEVREEIYKNINWWLDKGVSGFRIDAIINIKKPLFFKNYEADREDGLSSIDNMLKDARGIGQFLREMKERTFAPHDAFSVGEVFNEDKDEIPDYIGEDGYFSSMFDFEETICGSSEKGWYDNSPCTPEDYKDAVIRAQTRVGNIGFLSNIIENHDEPRGVSRYLPASALKNPETGQTAKKLLATVYFLLRGLPFIYQGQEIGMENTVFGTFEAFDDISSIDQYKVALDAGLSPEEALRRVSLYSRDNARTPVQWSSEANAGFTTGIPWLPVNPNYEHINVEDSIENPASVLNHYRRLIRLRKDPSHKDTFVYGDFVPYMPEEKDIFAYFREYEGQRILVIGNFSDEPHVLPIPSAGNVLLNNTDTDPKMLRIKDDGQAALHASDIDVRKISSKSGVRICLSPYQAVVLEL